MIRKEAVTLSQPDPAVVKKLTELRNRIIEYDSQIAQKAEESKKTTNYAASLAREHKAHEAHARLRMEEDMHRPPDRTYAIRPQSLSDKELDTFRNIRRWYAGGDYTADVSLRERISPPTLLQTGYAITRDQAPLSTRPLPLHSAASPLHTQSSATSASSSSNQPLWNTLPNTHASMNARSMIRQHWQQNSNVHWFNREQTMATEAELAQKLLKDTAYSPDLVQRSRPFRSFPKEENGLQNEWRRPPTQELLQKEQLKYTAVKDRDPYEAKRRVLELRRSRPEDYFGGISE